MKSILVAVFFVVSHPFLFGQAQSPKVKRGNYSIQHFNKRKEKRRVKTKLEIFHKYVILPNGDLAQDDCYWRRDEN